MLAIIGGTGIYQLNGLTIIDELSVDTPFGKPSAAIVKAQYQDKTILFLPRHGKHHEKLPHEINYCANIFALKKLGAKQVLGFSAVGSLSESIRPGDFAIATQYFDFIKGARRRTFFGDGIAAHISTAKPTCPNLSDWAFAQAKKMQLTLHDNKTYVCVDGPRLGTQAESHFFRQINCHLVGMTNVPEVFLAREAQLCYATIGIVTDYDCWQTDESMHVSVSQVIERYGKSLAKAQQLILALLATPLPSIDENYRQSLKYALLTKDDKVPQDKKIWLNILKQ